MQGLSDTITAIVLTFNEEIHLERCLKSINLITDKINVIDSFSTDNTDIIAKKNGADFYQNKWENSYAKQFNWGLNNLPIKTKWILRIDADEYLDPSFVDFINNELDSVNDNISGILVNRRTKFFRKEIKHGGKKFEWQLRLFRFGKGFCEKRWMDEHIKITEGETIKVKAKLIDENLNNFT